MKIDSKLAKKRTTGKGVRNPYNFDAPLDNVEKKQAQRISGGVGVITVNSTFNNTKFTITEPNGNVLFSGSPSQTLGFKGAKKSTPYAAQKVAEMMLKRAQRIGIQTLSVKIRGIGPGVSSVIRKLSSMSPHLQVSQLSYLTSEPHNGCRKPKDRRS